MVALEGIRKRFGPIAAVDGVDLTIASGEFFALLGGSGCGKTTLLRMIAGLESPDAGRILIGDLDATALAPWSRPVNTVFQSYALFPHLSVAANVGYGLVRERLARADIAKRVREMLALVQLTGFEDRRPHQLSGGQRQRVALARALAKLPQILLLDEPMAALDRGLREETRAQLVRVQRQLGITFVLVTHDQEEAMALADRVGVMRAGRIAQLGSPRDVYDAPADRGVAAFLGRAALIDGQVLGRDGSTTVIDGGALGRLRGRTVRELAAGSVACLVLRPEHLRLVAPGEGALRGTVGRAAFLGESVALDVTLETGLDVTVSLPARTIHPARDTTVGLRWDESACVIVPR